MFVPRRNALLVLCFIFLSGFQFAKTFNLETRIPVIKTGNVGSYFGYSVAEHITYDTDGPPISWLLVGAPLDDNLQPNTNKSGALWKCPLTTRGNDCEQVITDGRRSIDSNDLKPPGADEIKNGQWLGVSVRSQGGVSGKAVVCAHRYTKMNGESQLGQGLCYTLDNKLDYDDNWEPCAGRPISKEHQEWGLCQAGTSSSILEDGTMIIGSPGPYTWRGTVFVLDTQEDFLMRDKIPYVGPTLKDISPVAKYSYLVNTSQESQLLPSGASETMASPIGVCYEAEGMAVTGGKYFGPNYSYAAGAPRAVGTGQVIIFSKNIRPPSNPINVSLIISGEQFASNFGYELTTADLNGDGKPDLIISAPFYFGRDSGGAVYVYINQNNGFDSGITIKLTGKPESRFGFALANAGDLNKDGCDDLAIGSPYEGSGVVYIYLGNRQNGLDSEPKQIITAEMLPKPLKTFGYSLSGGTDLDGNGYPDLLVGAYEQDSIALLRGRPIIDIKTYVRNNNTLKNIDPSRHGCEKDPESSNTCFSFETCCTIETLVKPSSVENLTLNYVIEAETFAGGKKFSRVYFGGTPGNKTMHIIRRNIRVTNNRVHCQEHTVYVQENARDIQTPIKFHVNYTLVQSEPRWSERGPLPSLEALPVLNATQATLQFEATLLRDCGADDICESDIAIGAALVLPTDTKGEYVLTLGQENEVRLVVTTENLGESAYESQLFVMHHKGLNYVAVNVIDKHIICNLFNKTLVVCSLGNPFKKQLSDAHPITLRFDPKPLEDHELSVDFVIWANSTSKDVEPNRKPLRIEALVVKNAELTIKGSARPEQVFYGGAVKGETAMEYLDDIGSRVLHTYQIFNLGPWRVNSVEVILEWPHQVANNKPLGKWLLYLESDPVVDAIGGGKCHPPSRDVNPLGLKVRPGVDEPPLENLRMEPFLISGVPDRAEGPGFYNRSAELRSRRERRDSEMVVKPEAYTDKDGIRHQVVNMNCQQGTAKCIKIRCVIYKLSRNQEATIRIYGRLWNSTLVEDYPRVAFVSVGSRATLSLPTHFNIHQSNVEDDTVTVETIAYPDLVTVEQSEIPLWVYIASAILGLLLLIIVIFFLWKFGFFKRRRPDNTLSGNIKKNHEGSPFLGKAL